MIDHTLFSYYSITMDGNNTPHAQASTDKRTKIYLIKHSAAQIHTIFA